MAKIRNVPASEIAKSKGLRLDAYPCISRPNNTLPNGEGPGDECPNCHSGTIGKTGDRVIFVCQGECGAFFLAYECPECGSLGSQVCAPECKTQRLADCQCGKGEYDENGVCTCESPDEEMVEISLSLTPSQWQELANAVASKETSVSNGEYNDPGLTDDEVREWAVELSTIYKTIASELEKRKITY